MFENHAEMIGIEPKLVNKEEIESQSKYGLRFGLVFICHLNSLLPELLSF